MTIGTLVLAPAFDTAVLEYTAITSNATDVITAIPSKDTATIVITVTSAGENMTTVTNGQAVTWGEGISTVEVTVTDVSLIKKYKVMVTKEEI